MMRIERALACVLLLVLAVPSTPVVLAQAPPADGGWDDKFRGLPDPAKIRETMRRLSARPHHVGSPYDKDNAEWMLARFKEWGWDAQIETLRRALPDAEGARCSRWSSRRASRPSSRSRPSPSIRPRARRAEQLPTYNAYSIDGDVTGAARVRQLRPARRTTRCSSGCGISVKGAIVIARYGESWRGIKPKVAAEHGAIGCLIYSDPKDDGYCGGRGVSRRARCARRDGVQRGSVMDMPVYPGDPLTPGVGATRGRQAPGDQGRDDADEDSGAADLVRRRAAAAGGARPGRSCPRTGAAALPITYRIGPGPAKVHLKLAFNWDLKPLYNVIARIPGIDAIPTSGSSAATTTMRWVNGAEDPVERHGGRARRGARARRAAQAGLGAEADDRLLRLGRRGAGAARIHRMGRGARRRAAAEGGASTSTPTATAAAFSSAGGSHALERFINDVARDIAGSRDRRQRLEARAGERASSTRQPADERKDARSRARPADRRARIGLRLHAVPAAPRHADAEHRLRRRGRRRDLPLDLRRLLSATRSSSTPTSSTAGRWRRPSAPR